jgi:NADH-quinone oxidoreductase subunit M
MIGTFNAQDTFPSSVPHYLPAPHLLGVLAATGVVLGAIYLLYMFQKVFFGKLDTARNGHLPDLRLHERITFVVLAIAIVLGGLFPKKPLEVTQESVDAFIAAYQSHVSEPDCPQAHEWGKKCEVAP